MVYYNLCLVFVQLLVLRLSLVRLGHETNQPKTGYSGFRYRSSRFPRFAQSSGRLRRPYYPCHGLNGDRPYFPHKKNFCQTHRILFFTSSNIQSITIFTFVNPFYFIRKDKCRFYIMFSLRNATWIFTVENTLNF